ncbi:hypothetical protein [Pedobacter insulae]|uniref:Uncharacterized protein n=1 Tax=Pedobacter insulae TaxID=414048 RepID=A0A1I2ZJC9_9SPHI|nr:hypothetical protein [Pedobacter insulae]SFH37972.1 hypothetical protein SAMN04489864_11079 [Pedobacter insulae]
METQKRKLADWLRTQSEKQAPRTRKIILFSIALFLCAYAVGLILGAISYEFQKPAGISKAAVLRSDPDVPMKNRSTSWYISKFRYHMDSLSKTSAGRIQRDSILQRHPGIMDTIAMLEQIINHSK